MRTTSAGRRQQAASPVDVRPLTRDRLPDLSDLFATTAMTSRCHCTYFLLSARERMQVWPRGEARACFEEHARVASAPVGVLAYREGRAVGWCAAARRAAYPTVLRSPLFRSRDPHEDDAVWFASCFYV